MADKRISQLTDRGTVANSDVVPIVVSGAVTTNKATISSIQTFMQGNLDLGVTSVGLSMPSAFTVTGSPVTSSGNISVVGAGTVSQYIRGDGSLADFPQGGGGGGASVNYYLNLSVSQGSIGGIGYSQMSRVPVFGAGTDTAIASNGYIASFITDAGNPALLEIPAGNWNFETYFSANANFGSPKFYIELYKVNSGGTATLIASNSATPEDISFGTTIHAYFSALAVPTTSLTLTDRLAIRIYVLNSGRTITLHTENSHLCQIITTFTTGLTALNGLTAQVQNFATGSSGTDFTISSSTSTHTFNLPTASATNRGLLSSADWTTFNNKAPSVAGGYVPYTGAAANVDLGVYNLTASAVNVNGSGSNAGVINLESNAIFPLVNGYGTIGSGTTNQFNFYQTTGAGVFRGAILSLNSITASATRTYTLPDSDGTLALTSQIPANLITGTGVAGQVAYWNGTNSQAGSNNLVWDNANIKLGIGTNTPEGTGLTVAGGGVLVSLDSGAARKVLELYATSTGAKVSSTYVGASSYGTLELLTSNVARLTIASTGEATFSSSVTAASGTINGTTDAFFDLNRNASGSAGRVRFQTAGTDEFEIGLKGGVAGFHITKGDATELVTVLTGGNVGIGTASPLGNLEIQGANRAVGSDGILQVNSNNSQAIDLGGSISFGGVWQGTSVTEWASVSGRKENSTSGQYGGYLSLGTRPHLGVITERMRIISSGFLKASNTGSYWWPVNNFHTIENSIADWTCAIANTNSVSPSGVLIAYNLAIPNNFSNNFIFAADQVATRFVAYSNGGIGNYQANNLNLSDERTKKDIEPLESYWDKFKAIQIVKFKYKDQTHDDYNIGVIAQQVEAVAPEFVDVDVWDTKPKLDEEGNEISSEEEPLKSIYTADLHHATIKVLQEAMAKIEKLEIEISSLKNQIK